MAEFDPAEYGDSGTYDVPGVGLVVNGVLVDTPAAAEEVGFGRVTHDPRQPKPLTDAPKVRSKQRDEKSPTDDVAPVADGSDAQEA